MMYINATYISDLPENCFRQIGTILENANLVKAVWRFYRTKSNALCVVNRKSELRGIISWNDFNIKFATEITFKNQQEIEKILKYPNTKVGSIMVTNLVSLSYKIDTVKKLIDYLVTPQYISGGYRNDKNTSHHISQILITEYSEKKFYSIDYQDILGSIEGSKDNSIKTLLSDIYFPLEIEREATIRDAEIEMNSQSARQLMVVDEDKQPVGIVSDTAILGTIDKTQSIRNITEGFVEKLYDDDPISKAIEIFRRPDRKFRIYPIWNRNNKFINLLSYQDVLRAVVIKSIV